MKKILFNDHYGLTKAVFIGKKTQTRRILKPQPTYSDKGGICWKGGAYGLSLWGTIEGACDNFISGIKYRKDRNIPYKVGDEVAIAESYKTIYDDDPKWYEPYKNLQHVPGWKNKMFVKAEFMRRTIIITRMELQRLQDISDEDCIAEGIRPVVQEGLEKPRGYIYNYRREETAWALENVRDAYAILIDRICGKGTWESNPWVLKYEFKLRGTYAHLEK